MKDVFYFLKQVHLYTGNILYLNLFAMASIGLLESVGILLLTPMLGLTGIIDLEAPNGPFFTIFGFLGKFPSDIGLPLVLGMYVLLVISQNALQRKITVRNAVIQNGFLRYMRTETYKVLLHSNWRFFIENKKSDLLNLLLNEVTRATAGTNAFLQFIASLLFTLIQIGLAFFLSPSITTFVLLAGGILVFLNRKFLKASLALGNKNYELNKVFFAGVTDQLNGIKDIKSNTLEKSRIAWFKGVSSDIEKEQIEYTKMKTTSQLYYKVASALLIAVFIYIAINTFQAQAAQLMLIIIIFSRLWPKVAGIQSSMEQLAMTIPSFKAVKAFQYECKNAKEFESQSVELIPSIHLCKGIECRDVSFRYSIEKPSYALKNLTISFPANQMTAVVGRSGAGKSTLIDLLMGLNKPESGQVLVDGIPLSAENVLSLRKSVSYVAQDPFLFNTSIRENLQLIVPEAGEAQIWEALAFASAADFVRNLPQGLDTVIGDRGIKLSGGERQRIVLARAILRNPSILVLDEATSALDTENETRIQEAIERLKGKMTIIVIAHRLSTIRNADQVIVLEKGEVAQQGAFSQLSQEKNKVFSKLLSSQAAIMKQG